MADVTLTGVERSGDKLTLTGTGFTKTTTTVYVGSESVPFEWISDTEVTIAAVTRGPISVEKGGVTSASKSVPAAGAAPTEEDPDQPGHTADTSTTEEGEDDLADATKSELAGAASSSGTEAAPAPASAEFKGPPDDPKTAPHLEAEGFRQEVENTAAGDLNMDPLEPYPTGNPPDPREAYHRIHGRYPPDEEEKPNA